MALYPAATKVSLDSGHCPHVSKRAGEGGLHLRRGARGSLELRAGNMHQVAAARRAKGSTYALNTTLPRPPPPTPSCAG